MDKAKKSTKKQKPKQNKKKNPQTRKIFWNWITHDQSEKWKKSFYSRLGQTKKKKESVSSNIGHLKLPSQRGKKKTEQKEVWRVPMIYRILPNKTIYRYYVV